MYGAVGSGGSRPGGYSTPVWVPTAKRAPRAVAVNPRKRRKRGAVTDKKVSAGGCGKIYGNKAVVTVKYTHISGPQNCN